MVRLFHADETFLVLLLSCHDDDERICKIPLR